jgi:hypothetical protein
MTKKRYSVYISEPLARKFDLVASRHPRARSALIEEALRAQLEPAQYPGIDDTLGRQLDDLQNTIANIQLYRSIISETLAVFSRYVLTVTPMVPQSELESARQRGSERYTHLIAEVARRLAGGYDFVSEVLATTGPQQPEDDATASGDGSPNDGNGDEQSSPGGPSRKPKRA